MVTATKPFKTAVVPFNRCDCLEERVKNVLVEAIDQAIEVDTKQIDKIDKQIVKVQDEISMLPEKYQEDGAPATFSHLTLNAHFAMKNALERHRSDAQEILQFISKKPVCRGSEGGGSAGGSELPPYVTHRETPPAKLKIKGKKTEAAAAVPEEEKQAEESKPMHGKVTTRKATKAELEAAFGKEEKS